MGLRACSHASAYRTSPLDSCCRLPLPLACSLSSMSTSSSSSGVASRRRLRCVCVGVGSCSSSSSSAARLLPVREAILRVENMSWMHRIEKVGLSSLRSASRRADRIDALTRLGFHRASVPASHFDMMGGPVQAWSLSPRPSRPPRLHLGSP